MAFTCVKCQSSDYAEEDGHYYCNECGTLSQEMIVQETEVDTDIVLSGTFRHEVKTSVQNGTKQTAKPKTNLGRPWTVYEAYQFIILAQSDALVQLGAREELKDIVFTIWANYLSKLRVAFCTAEQVVPSIVTKEKVGRTRELHRGTKQNPLNRRKRPLLEKSDTSGASFGNLNEEFYDDKPEDHDTDNIVFLRQDDVDRKEQRRRYKRAKYSSQWMDMKKTISFCCIGLLQTNPDILPIDVIRWIYNGKIPFLCATHCLPEDMILSGGDMKLFETGRFDTETLKVTMRQLIRFLKLKLQKTIPQDNIEVLICRFIDELNLPDDLKTICCRLSKRCSLKSVCGKSVEMVTFSYIMLALKIVFGLDDVKERVLSDFSKKLQPFFHSKSKLFVWDDWVSFIMKAEAEKFDAYKLLTERVSSCSTLYLHKFLDCHKNFNRENRRFSTSYGLNHKNKRLLTYATPEFWEELRKPLSIAEERLEKNNSNRKDPVHDDHTNLKAMGKSFQCSSLSHIMDMTHFKMQVENTTSGETRMELLSIINEYKNLGPQLSSYKRATRVEDLPEMRHSNYLWVLQLFSNIIDCKILNLDNSFLQLLDEQMKKEIPAVLA